MLTLAPESDRREERDLRVTLTNCGEQRLRVLFDHLLEPPRPRLRDARGTPVPFTDKRRAMKFDRSVTAESFVELAPGENLTMALAIDEDDGRFDLSLGPFEAQGLAPGHYTLTIGWSSRAAPGGGGWQGRVESEPYSLRLGT